MVQNTSVFTRGTGWLTAHEKTAREAVCLNGRWAFQPVPVPPDYRRNTGVPPELPPPLADGWDATPLIVPSPWNGNTWGNGRIDRENDERRRYYPDSVYYPSYPAAWDHAEMGWLRRCFAVPESWGGKRILLHFEAVMGNADIFVNGKFAGSHFDGYLPFTFDVTGLVHPGENELLAGVRRLHLYDEQSAVYAKMRTPYAHGSNTQGLGGIWQDIWLLAVPEVYIADVFVQPYCSRDRLCAAVTMRNAADKPRTVTVSGEITGWRDEKPLLRMDETAVEVPASGTAVITLETAVGGALEHWSMDSPALYTLALTAGEDRKSCRFGWREFSIAGKNLLLNGEPVRLVGDICHPFGPYMFSREWIESWYQLIKAVGGNAVRLHAQPHPRLFLEIADEMGIAVMDETAIFGSCLSLNFESDTAWGRYAAHYDGLVLRDRNRPGVFGWSFGNELFAIFLYDEAAERDQDIFYEKLIALGRRSLSLDPTRDFVTCDGDDDLRGTLPVWSKHFGHGLRDLPQGIEKPMVIGE
ncbi:MAG: hypothetical protein FWE80_09635, partial [Oscillospiraceae bacterium]|nr:hypothetical protein [Oscillospiraceae bacterium]